MAFVDGMSIHDNSPEDFEKALAVFDDDADGTFAYKDIIRVMKELGECSDADVVKFLLRCEYGKFRDIPAEMHTKTLKEIEGILPLKPAKKR